MSDIFQESIEFHRKHVGKIDIQPKFPLKTTHDLSLAYSPGVAAPCQEIEKDPKEIYNLTCKANMVAVITDGSAVLGLGNIGAGAALPVMEGKAILFKEYAGIDAIPLCIETQETVEIIHIIKNLAPGLGGVNLEDISAPRCFEIEDALQDIGIPVFHDDQHGTAIVAIAALINAYRFLDRKFSDAKVVINGAGAAGSAIIDLLLQMSHRYPDRYNVKEIIICDTKGIISETRPDIAASPAKMRLARKTNRNFVTGNLEDAMKDSDIFIGVSVGDAVSQDMVRSMNPDPIILGLANPIPEIMPDAAYEAGAAIVGTGRSDLPNQVNNVLAFPGIFRGALDAKADRITMGMKIAAAEALAATVPNPEKTKILPEVLDKTVAYKVADAVAAAYQSHVSTNA